MSLLDATQSASRNEKDRSTLLINEAEAQSLAERLPDLLIEAMRISTTIAHGIHGRRRAGPGETFWQFRQYESTDAASLIDWRRSGSSDHLYVREREWEAAHTFWLWADLSPSMDFCSHLSQRSKRDRALVLLLAIAELLVRSGERVGLLGLTRPTANRKATARLTEVIAANISAPQFVTGLPPEERLPRHSGVVLIGDFLSPVQEINARVSALAASGTNGHLIQVFDPAEEALPYDGRAEFLSPMGGERWIADRVESLRHEYVDKLAAHKASIADHAGQLGWSHVTHHTDKSAADPLLRLIFRLQNSVASGGEARAGGFA
ncbi:MAG: DUF58 domain-containing protein [Hyphomicrobiaceae bacterium]